MTDNFENDFYNENNNKTEDSQNSVSDSFSDNTDINSSTNDSGDFFDNSESEGSYEWNAESSKSGSEYHYSYVNGNNQTASHNPNNYESAYSNAQKSDAFDKTSTENSYSSASNTSTAYGDSYNNTGSYNQNNSNSYTNYSQQSYGGYNNQNSYGGYSGTQYSGQQYTPHNNQGSPYNAQVHQKTKKARIKKEKKPVSRGFIAAVLIITVIASAALGFGGGYFSGKLGSSGNSSLNINKVESSGTSSTVTTGTASSVVQKASDSVVEITTESVVTGQFQSQYVSQGAGSGVIVSEDGYIITNNHVIDGASTITVTLRDGQTSYDATLIGTDEDNDIALIKVDATDLLPATFGDSSNLAVGDYVVAIGNPLGKLGGTVTDGIISALARQVTIDDQNMTLLQTNAQINPGNSGGGLFNANGELIGIVNAKTSATEIEGIGFAIPINNVLDIINDLKSYGYVTGKVDLGMEFVDINSTETAFYYGVNRAGCYVLSVTSDSNAEKAGFRSGDLINSVNGTDVTSSSEIDAIIDDLKIGDKVTFSVTRNGQTADLELTLAEYVPSVNTTNQNVLGNSSNSESDDSIWSDMFSWY